MGYVFIIFAAILYLSNVFAFETITSSIFYLFWAYLGFRLAKGLKLENKILMALIAIGIAVLVLANQIFDVSLNMQTNKFPPNLVFLYFSVIWVSFFLLLVRLCNFSKYYDALDNKFMNLFINHGYSIYLWQGLGYALAYQVQNKFGISVYLTWPLAVILTIILGTMFSPFEKVRFKTQKSELENTA